MPIPQEKSLYLTYQLNAHYSLYNYPQKLGVSLRSYLR